MPTALSAQNAQNIKKVMMQNVINLQGRCDSQIKVRGHRVDLSEIQTAVTKIVGVEKAIVLCYKPNEPAQKVICFYTTKTLDNEKVKRLK